MAVISTDPITTQITPGQELETSIPGRWGRGDFAEQASSDLYPSQVQGAPMSGRWGRGDFAISDLSRNAPRTLTRLYVYRGRVGNNYVFRTGMPPEGAADVVIVREIGV